MNRVTLATLDITNESLPTASLAFTKGLNVLSGVENPGKTYAFKWLDFMLGAKKPPRHNSHSVGYTTATVYFTINDERRGGVFREFESGDAYYQPLHALDRDVSDSDWLKLAKTHGAKNESISSYWLSAFGFEPTMLRKNLSGDMNSLTVRYLAHLVMIDEIRIMAEASTARTEQATGWTAEGDMFAHIIGARKNPPQAAVETVEEPILPAAVREFILQEVSRIEQRIAAFPTADTVRDEGEQIAIRAEEFTSAANQATREMQEALARIEEAQRGLTESRARTKVSREIAARLELLQEYYQTDLKRLEAVSETAFLMEQLNTVPCPTCLQPFADPKNSAIGEGSKEYLQQILNGARVEAAKIRRLGADLKVTLAKAREDFEEATSSEMGWVGSLEQLRVAASAQKDLVERARTQLAETFTTLGALAERRALKQRRSELLRQIPGEDTEPTQALPTDVRTDFDTDAVEGFCNAVKHLLEQWKWNYTALPLTVTFDAATTDILICGEARDSFGKAVRALISSAFIIGLMDYCFEKKLPHPGFVILDSPLTTKKDSNTSDTEEVVTNDILTAFFTYLARNYTDRQVIIIDNKEPPKFLEPEINHIRFDDPPISNRKGLFPPK
jgi:hypothetical protein